MEKGFDFNHLYNACYDKIEALKKEAITTQAAKQLVKAFHSVGKFIGKIPIIKDGHINECWISLGDTITDAEKKQLEKTLTFFIQYKDSDLFSVSEYIDTINQLANKPVVMLYNKNAIYFRELKEEA